MVSLLVAFGLRRSFRLPRRLPPVPEELTHQAVIPAIPGARYLVGADMEPFVRDVIAARQRETEFLVHSGHSGPLPPADLLAISGGGDKGAFGAGLLCGWSAAGNRPRFKCVTSISTGALIAPLAFLGSEYDELLRKIYTAVTLADIAEKRTILAAVNNDAMADNRPLAGLISKSIVQTMLSRIAKEHQNGRILLILTTNLDAREPVIWKHGKGRGQRPSQGARALLVHSPGIGCNPWGLSALDDPRRGGRQAVRRDARGRGSVGAGLPLSAESA